VNEQTISHWAKTLHEARLSARPIPQITQSLKLSRADAYAIQEGQFRLRQKAGEKQLGWKMGLTSEAKRKQMNLDSPLYGFLTDSMKVDSGRKFSLRGAIHPKIEPEVAFLVARELQGSVSRDQVLESCSAIAPCMEILDSRYEQFKYFSMEDVIADNSSSSHFVLGPWVPEFRSPDFKDLKSLKMEMSVNGVISQKGISSDISGDPVVSVIQLCELLAERGHKLVAGSIVLAGAATIAVELKPGMKIDLRVDSLPPISVSVDSSSS
jgi:2-oxo-3-hexenedioate decarboxylase